MATTVTDNVEQQQFEIATDLSFDASGALRIEAPTEEEA